MHASNRAATCFNAPYASVIGRHQTNRPSHHKLHDSFYLSGGRGQANAIAGSTTLNEEQPRESRPARTLRFQDSYDELVQSCSRDDPTKTEPARVVGYQRDPRRQERQREQQKGENKAASTIIDLREKINAGKRSREETEQSSSTTAPTPVAHAASPTQPQARKQKVARELLTSAEVQQLDITARDAVRLQREVPATTLHEDPLRQKFEVATGRKDPATQKKIEKATVGVLYNRPVKKPVFSTDGCPPWFNRLRADLERANSSYLRTPNNFVRQRPGRFDQHRLQSKNDARNPITILPMGKDLLQKTRIAFFVDSTIKSSYNSHNTLMDVRILNMPCTSLGRSDRQDVHASGGRTIPLPPLLL